MHHFYQLFISESLNLCYPGGGGGGGVVSVFYLKNDCLFAFDRSTVSSQLSGQ